MSNYLRMEHKCLPEPYVAFTRIGVFCVSWYRLERLKPSEKITRGNNFRNGEYLHRPTTWYGNIKQEANGLLTLTVNTSRTNCMPQLTDRNWKKSRFVEITRVLRLEEISQQFINWTTEVYVHAIKQETCLS